MPSDIPPSPAATLLRLTLPANPLQFAGHSFDQTLDQTNKQMLGLQIAASPLELDLNFPGSGA